MKNVLIFDYDGVIVDSYQIFMTNFINACKKEGWSSIATREDFLKIFEKNMYESMYAMGMKKEEIYRIINRVRAALIQNQDKLKTFKGINDILKVISKKNLLFIVTSNDTQVVEKYLRSQKYMVFLKKFMVLMMGRVKLKRLKILKKITLIVTIFI